MARQDPGEESGGEGDIRLDTPSDADVNINLLPQEEPQKEAGRTRRIVILAGVGVLLIGGLYLANQLFLSPPPPPPGPPPRTAAPVPRGATPAPAPATAPVTPPAPPAKAETKAPPATAATTGTKAPLPPAKAEAKGAPAVAKADANAPAPAAKSARPPLAPPSLQAKAAAPPAPLAKAAAPALATSFSLQVGAMVQQSNADALKRKLDAEGFPAKIRKGSVFLNKHVVTVGEPAGRSEAEELARRLNVDGFPSELVSLEGKQTPQVGAFFTLDDAIDLARELQKKNYRPKITARPVTTEVYQVRHGEFVSRAAAKQRGEELKAKGFTPVVVPN